ncbi:DNA-3-methyladenine glycosylase family protein [Streptomyces albus]|uniref:DNA-3-methyladenine glycosylase II n=1 Tax=Streptomyces albus TaxID=1888 RepID=A0A6C1CCI9_9ACTN|nr:MULTISPECIES: DNA-3-methyladenine glycosylase [Streptomyces]KPC75426.1 Fe-S cluster assembly protein HesB [Streptomyces sp. NRRL F-6602]QID39801.1 DNA-3-methyladenine glycosylase 2 family protein [Streptomyces albus]TGG83804.1 DNA-3-methyladenine glycosylase 2 family protein [Streptomyces albus]UVN53085.1 DNA-3-methyladenine glycosylase [Streptomyces albus]GHJ19097.1 DNA-3-methyladenine glycosylase II [Streptomyces albus]
MTAVSFTPKGPFSLAASIRFLEGFTPASYDQAPDTVLRLAFPTDDGQAVIGCALRQKGVADGSAAVHAEYSLYVDGTVTQPADGTPAAKAARAQIARVLSLDIDATGFPALADADPVIASLQAEFPGLRPVLFYSPYEAAAWTIIGNRIRRTQAARIKACIAQQYGEVVEVEGQRLHAFPAPDRLRRISDVPGLTDVKIERLRTLADAALDGRLDAAQLRAQPAEFALTDLKELPGIGPFSAELILIRGAGHPDVFPAHEPGVHQAMAAAYGLDSQAAASTTRLAAIADAWRPYRSWIALLLRAHAHERRANQV